MHKKVTIVTDRFYPDESSTSYFIKEITKSISDVNNGKINVICANDLSNKKELDFVKNKIIRLSNNKLSKNHFFSRIFKFLILSFKLSYLTYKNIGKNEKIFTYSFEPMVLFLAILKKIKKFKLIVLVYDVMPENLIAANIIKNNKSLIYQLLKKIFDWGYKQVDYLIVIGRDMREIMKQKTDNTTPIKVIPNWSNIDEIKFQSKRKNKLINKLKLQNMFVFSLVGNLGRLQGIEFLLEVSSLIKNQKFKLLFIGDGADLYKIKNHIKNKVSDNVVYGGNFSASNKNMILNACDISIVSLNKKMYGLGVPSRFYNNLAAKKPILYFGDKKSEIGLEIQQNNIGWICDDLKPSKVAKKIEDIMKDYKKIKLYSKNSRKLVEKKYSKEIITRRYRDFFNQIEKSS